MIDRGIVFGGLLVTLGACGTAPLTDAQVCANGCNALIACGVLYDATCAANCQAPNEATLLTCWKTAGSDCNALALCVYQWAAPLTCPGGGGVPAGGGTCSAARSCNGACFSSATPGPCACACATQLSPSKTINALIDTTCSLVRCSADCAPPHTAADCANCQSANCLAQAAQCANN